MYSSRCVYKKCDMYNLKVQFTALTKTFKEWEKMWDRVQIIDKYIKHRNPNIIKINIQLQCIEKLIELDTQLNEEFKLMRKNIHNIKNKKCWAKIKKTHIRKISK